MFKLKGCAPRGVVRDRRQQTGRALSPVRGGQDTTESVLNCVVTTREHYFRVVVETKRQRLNAGHPLCRGARSVDHVGDGAYEVVATAEVIDRILNGANVIRWHEVRYRAHGPSLQQSRPYHRR